MGTQRTGSAGLDTSARGHVVIAGATPSRDSTAGIAPFRKRSRARAATVALVLGSMCLLSMAFAYSHEKADNEPLSARSSYTAHAPIIIYRDADFNATNGVVSGTGAPDDPYIISGWDISTETIDACIFVFRTTVHYVIQDCHLHCPGAVCLEIQEAPHGDVVNCTVDTGDYGIIAVKCNDINFTGNSVSNMENLSMMVSQGRWANVTDNQLGTSTGWGMIVSWTQNGTVERNRILDNPKSGLQASNSTDVTIRGNNVSGSGWDGLWFDRVSRLTAQENNITSNGGTGIRVTNSTSVSIFHNRIIGNAVQAYQETVTDVSWDDGYPSGGNYWSDYAGVDLYSGPDQDVEGADGIGDTPYAFSQGGLDRYPFMDEGMEPIPEFGPLALPVFGTALLLVVALRPGRRP